MTAPQQPVISFVTANFVARQLDYRMTGGWAKGDRATNEYFRPLESFGERFEALLREIRALDFDTIDLWSAHLNWRWATDEHVKIARELLAKHRLSVASLAGGLGDDRESFEGACRLAATLDVPLLGGVAPFYERDRASAIALLKEHGVKLGIENHPEKTPDEILAKIGDGGAGHVGTAVDTGWYGTQGYDAADAIERLDGHIFAVHLKDVRAAGAHDTCRYGQGIVLVERCVATLRRIGYAGPYTVEHEPETFDPTEDCRVMRSMVRRWLA